MGHEAMYHDMADVLGHPLKLSVSLQRLMQDTGAWDRFVDDYCNWIGGLEFIARDLCFLDITFTDISQRAKSEEHRARTLLLASAEKVVNRHKDVLKAMFQSGYSTTAHPVFQKGLPRFQRVVNGTVEVLPAPETGLELTRLLNDRGCDIITEGFALAVFDAPPGQPADPVEGPESSAQGHLSPPLAYAHFPTYQLVSGLPNFFAQVSEKPFTEVWEKSMAFYRAARAELPSRKGQPLSVFVGAPVGVRSQTNRGRFLRFADVYFGLAGNTSDEHQKDLLKEKAVRLLRLLMAQLYRANMSSFAHTLGVMESGQAFGHEVKNIAIGLAGGWMPPAEELFEITLARHEDIPYTGAGGGASPPQLVGKIYIDRELGWLQQELGVLPIRQLLIHSGQLIRAWCMLEKNTDFSDIVRGNAPLQTIVERCTRRAWDHMMPHLLNQKSFGDRVALRKAKKLYETLNWLFAQQQRPITYHHGADEVQILWTRHLTWLARILTAALKGCVQHGDPLLPVNILVSRNQVLATYTVEIRGSKRRAKQLLAELLLERMAKEEDGAQKREMQEVAVEALDLLYAADAGAATLGQQFRTKDVLELCLSKIGGELEEFSGAESDPHVVRFTCPIPVKEFEDESSSP